MTGKLKLRYVTDTSRHKVGVVTIAAVVVAG